MKSEAIDWRAVGVGALVEAAALFVLLTIDLGLGFTPFLVLVGSLPVLAGVAVGLTTRGYNGETLEGSFAAAGGLVLGVVGVGVFQAATAGSLALAYKLDVLFLVLVFGAAAFFVVAPAVYVLGGLVTEKVSRRRRDTGTDSLEVDWAATGEE